MATAFGDAFSGARYKDRGLLSSVQLGNEVIVGSQSADLGYMELAMELVTAERVCSLANRRNLDLQGLLHEGSEASDSVSWCS